VAKDACCVNAMRSGAMLRGRGDLGWCIGPATACSTARGDQDARSPLRAGAGLAGPVHARSAGRCRPEPSQHCRRSSTAAPEAGMHHLVMEGVEAQSTATAPASRCRSGTTRPAARPASWSPNSSRTPTSRSGGRSTASARSWSAAASSAADVLTGRAAPARVGATVLRNPITGTIQMADEVSWLDGTNTASFGVASVADAPGGGGGGQVVGPAHRRAPGPSRAAAMAA
jgi:hypothetical protein